MPSQGNQDTRGAITVGPCLTDAAPKDRSQRTARILTAMAPPERMRRQSSRLSWPGGSIRTSMTTTATNRILAQLLSLSREWTIASSISMVVGGRSNSSEWHASFDRELERSNEASPAPAFLSREGRKFTGTHVFYGNADLLPALDKPVARQ
jgi:hypothetical protein